MLLQMFKIITCFEVRITQNIFFFENFILKELVTEILKAYSLILVLNIYLL